LAEKPDTYDQLPVDVKDLMKEARGMMGEVLKRIEDSAKKYGAAYTLADISEELNQEVFDIVGWPLLEAIRIKLILSKRLAVLDEKYLEKFLTYHNIEYLKMLRDKIDEEIMNRT